MDYIGSLVDYIGSLIQSKVINGLSNDFTKTNKNDYIIVLIKRYGI